MIIGENYNLLILLTGVSFFHIFFSKNMIAYAKEPKRANEVFDTFVMDTKVGSIKGRTYRTIGGKKVQAALGIPYAKPPVGPLRFRDSVPYGKWSYIRDGTKYITECYQMYHRHVIGAEDCLHLNVFSPDVNSSRLYPVIFFIHGGMYDHSSSDPYNYGPEMLLDYDVVLVTINYRLGIFGFASTGDKDLSGNAGLKDQLLALKWVKENIVAFRGNADNVTLMGVNAGAACVHFHTLSPLSKGLFVRGIMLSGSGYNPWSLINRNKTITIFRDIALQLRCRPQNTNELLSCLKDQRNRYFLTQTYEAEIHGFLCAFRPPFTAILENPSVSSFLTLESYTSQSTVPLIMGVTKNEGKIVIASYHRSKFPIRLLVEPGFATVHGPILYLNDKVENPKSVTKLIRKAYLGKKNLVTQGLEVMNEIYSDVLIYNGTKEAIRRHGGPMYFYKFSFQGRYTYVYRFSKNRIKEKHVSHMDDTQYIFPMKEYFPERLENLPLYSDPEKKLIQRLSTYITNFAKTGNPNSVMSRDTKWDPISGFNDFRHLDIDENVQMVSTFRPESDAFFTKLNWAKLVLKLPDQF